MTIRRIKVRIEIETDDGFVAVGEREGRPIRDGASALAECIERAKLDTEEMLARHGADGLVRPTRHNHNVVFGRIEAGCQRCDELKAGATPRTWSR